MLDKPFLKLKPFSKLGLTNRFKAQVIERRPGHPDEGKVIRETELAPNLILANGMDKLATKTLCDLFLACCIGTGTTPTVDTSGSITATSSGTTVTAGTAFFSSAHIGELLVFDQNHKAVVTAVADSTHCTIANAFAGGDVTTPTIFNLYRIAQAGLDTEVHRSTTYLTGAGNCGTTRSGNQYTHQRTYDFPIETVDRSYYEVGFSDSGTAGANLNMRGIFSGAPVVVLTGQQLRVVYYVILQVGPTTPRAQTASISGWPALQYSVVADPSTSLITLVNHGFAANTQISFQGAVAPGGLTFGTPYYVVSHDVNTFGVSATPGGSAITLTSAGSTVYLFTNTNGQEQLTTEAVSSIQTDGTTSSVNGSVLNEPYSSTRLLAISNSVPTIPSWPVSSMSGWALFDRVNLTPDTYTLGSRTLTYRATFGVGQGLSSSIRLLVIGQGLIGVAEAYLGPMFLFDLPQYKDNRHTLMLVFQYSWDWLFI